MWSLLYPSSITAVLLFFIIFGFTIFANVKYLGSKQKTNGKSNLIRVKFKNHSSKKIHEY